MNTITGQNFTQKIGEPNSPQNTHTLLLENAKDTEYVNCTFDGDGVKLDNCTNIAFRGCTIKNAKRTSGNHHAIFGGGNNNITFDGCTIQDCTAVGQWYNGNNFSFTNNKILRVGYGFKGSVGGSKNWVISGNIIKRDRAMGFELQYDDANTDGIRFVNNSYDEAERWNDDTKNNGATMAFSLPFVAAKNVLIEGNYASGLCWLIDANGQRQTQTGWLGVRIGIECGGQGTVVRNNWIGPTGGKIHDAGSVVPNSANCNVNNNLIQGSNEPFNMQGGGAPGSNSFTSNGPGVILPATGGWTLVGAVPPGTVPPVSPPVVTPPAEVWTDVGVLQKSDQNHYRIKP